LKRYLRPAHGPGVNLSGMKRYVIVIGGLELVWFCLWCLAMYWKHYRIP